MTNKSKIDIKVDPRIELLLTVQILSDYDNIICKNGYSRVLLHKETEYLNGLTDYFSDSKGHPVLKLSDFLTYNKFWFEYPINTMLYLSKPPDLDIDTSIPSNLYQIAGGKRNINKFICELRDFSRKTCYMNFFRQNYIQYEKIAEKLKDVFNVYNSINILEDYYGVTKKNYTVFLTQLTKGCYGAYIGNDLYYICGVSDIDFSNLLHIELLNYNLWHQFSHAFVEPLVEKFKNKINKYIQLYSEIQNDFNVSWHEYVTENVIRAVTLRLAYKHMGSRLSDMFLEYEYNNGYKYVPEMYMSLEAYENEKIRHPKFESYLPILLEIFEAKHRIYNIRK